MLILGKNGPIGERLRNKLEEEGHEVDIRTFEPAEDVPADLFAGVSVCFVLAYDFEPIDIPISNIDFLRRLKSLALREKVERFVLLTAIHNPEPGRPIYYDVLARAEALLGEGAIPLSSLRTSLVLDPEMVFIKAIRNYAAHKSSPLLPEIAKKHECQPVLLDEMIEVLVRSVDHDLARPYYFDIGGKDLISYYDLVQRFIDQEMKKRKKLGVKAQSTIDIKDLSPLERTAWNVFLEKTSDNMVISRESASEYFGDIKFSSLAEVFRKV